MKIAVCSDLHIGVQKPWASPIVRGVNTRTTRALNALAYAIDEAEARECTFMFIVGDLFDLSNPTPALVARVLDLVDRSPDDTAMRIIPILGNHDINSDTGDDHAMGPLYHAHSTGVVDDAASFECGEKIVVAVPYRTPVIDALAQAKARRGDPTEDDGKAVLLLHAGIEDLGTPEYMRGAKDSIGIEELVDFCLENKFAYVFAGNWHKPTAINYKGVSVVQCGAMIPQSFSDANQDGYLYVFDTDTGRITKDEVPGPRFYTVEDWRRHGEPAPHLDNFFLVSARPEDVPAVKEKFKHTNFKIKLLLDEQKEQARSAAKGARSAPTIDQALRAYVNKMPEQKDVDPQSVLDRVRRYLRR